MSASQIPPLTLDDFSQPPFQPRANERLSECLPADDVDVEDEARVAGAPSTFYCSVCMEIMRDPVLLPTGMTYERRAIQQWLAAGGRTCPTTGQAIPRDVLLIPNMAMRQSIEEWAAHSCPAILDPASGGVRASAEEVAAPAEAEAEAVAAPAEAPAVAAAAATGGVFDNNEQGNFPQQERGADGQSASRVFLTSVLGVAQRAVGYTQPQQRSPTRRRAAAADAPPTELDAVSIMYRMPTAGPYIRPHSVPNLSRFCR